MARSLVSAHRRPEVEPVNENYVLVYGHCACSVWPLGMPNKVGRCGYCRTRPAQPFHQMPSSAAVVFHDKYGFMPVMRTLEGK